jgi:hypothetical protein
MLGARKSDRNRRVRSARATLSAQPRPQTEFLRTPAESDQDKAQLCGIERPTLTASQFPPTPDPPAPHTSGLPARAVIIDIPPRSQVSQARLHLFTETRAAQGEFGEARSHALGAAASAAKERQAEPGDGRETALGRRLTGHVRVRILAQNPRRDPVSSIEYSRAPAASIARRSAAMFFASGSVAWPRTAPACPPGPPPLTNGRPATSLRRSIDLEFDLYASALSRFFEPGERRRALISATTGRYDLVGRVAWQFPRAAGLSQPRMIAAERPLTTLGGPCRAEPSRQPMMGPSRTGRGAA